MNALIPNNKLTSTEIFVLLTAFACMMNTDLLNIIAVSTNTGITSLLYNINFSNFE